MRGRHHTVCTRVTYTYACIRRPERVRNQQIRSNSFCTQVVPPLSSRPPLRTASCPARSSRPRFWPARTSHPALFPHLQLHGGAPTRLRSRFFFFCFFFSRSSFVRCCFPLQTFEYGILLQVPIKLDRCRVIQPPVFCGGVQPGGQTRNKMQVCSIDIFKTLFVLFVMVAIKVIFMSFHSKRFQMNMLLQHVGNRNETRVFRIRIISLF